MLPPGGAGSPYRAFPPLGITMLLGLMVVGLLGVPVAFASTLVTPPTRDRSVLVTDSMTLPEDRWSSSGAALVDGDVFL